MDATKRAADPNKQTDDERVSAFRQALYDVVNKAEVPLSVKALVLECAWRETNAVMVREHTLVLAVRQQAAEQAKDAADKAATAEVDDGKASNG